MKEVNGDLWDANADIIVITTNGATRKDGAAIMGRGVALQAKYKYSDIEHILGGLIRQNGNHVNFIIGGLPKIISFPVKHHWRERADLKLINQSAIELVQLVDRLQLHLKPSFTYTVALPRPGCSNGRLRWEDVRSIIRPVFDDRFTVYNKE